MLFSRPPCVRLDTAAAARPSLAVASTVVNEYPIAPHGVVDDVACDRERHTIADNGQPSAQPSVTPSFPGLGLKFGAPARATGHTVTGVTPTSHQHHHHHDGDGCNCYMTAAQSFPMGLTQSLSEVQFQNGLWGAICRGGSADEIRAFLRARAAQIANGQTGSMTGEGGLIAVEGLSEATSTSRAAVVGEPSQGMHDLEAPGSLPVWLAALSARERAAVRLIVNQRDASGYTPLLYAVNQPRDDVALCRVLLDGGADAMALTPSLRQTTLTRAACRGHKMVVRELLRHLARMLPSPSGDGGGDAPNSPTAGSSASAGPCGTDQQVTPLAAFVHSVDGTGQTARDWALRGGHADIVEVLGAFR